MTPITTMRQVYHALAATALLGDQRAREGPARARASSGSSAFSTSCCLQPLARALRRRVRDQARPDPDDRRSLLPWHVAMWLKDGSRFIDEYLFTHILNRAGASASTSRSARSSTTRRRSATACGCGPRCCRPALAAAFLRARTRYARGPRPLHDRRCGRSRRRVLLRSSRPSSTTTSCRSCPRSAILVAFFLDDSSRGASACIRCYAALGVGIVLLSRAI